MKSYSLWIDKKKQAKIYQKKLVYNKNNKTVLVKTIYSGISKGTEKLVSSKSVSKDQFELMKAPFQEGSFNLPIKYGYINVGNIIDGPRKYINKKIFSLYPHQDLYEISIQNLIFLPKGNLRKYVLTARLGSVGLLTAFFFKINGYKNVYVFDNNKNKRKIANYLGLNFIDIRKIEKIDVAINTTANYKVLNSLMEKLSIEGKIVEASWYGKNKGEVALGGYFHSKRLKIISSQVSKIPKYMKNKYDFEGRLKLAIKSLKNSKLEKLITSESNFFDLEKDYYKILQNKDTIMHLVKY
jgi:hypothetical protein